MNMQDSFDKEAREILRLKTARVFLTCIVEGFMQVRQFGTNERAIESFQNTIDLFNSLIDGKNIQEEICHLDFKNIDSWKLFTELELPELASNSMVLIRDSLLSCISMLSGKIPSALLYSNAVWLEHETNLKIWIHNSRLTQKIR